MTVKKKIMICMSVMLLIASIGIIIFAKIHKHNESVDAYQDGIEWIDPDTIHFEDSKIYVDFSKVILSEQKEQRKLIVAEQTAKVSVDLKDKMFDSFDIDFLDKNQKVWYNSTGYFVVDLDTLTEKDIVDDRENKKLIITIAPPRLDDVNVDPSKVIINNVEGGLFSKSDIKMTVRDYNKLEREIKKQFVAMLETETNMKKARENAIEMVKKTYEPVVQAIDSEYEVIVEIK